VVVGVLLPAGCEDEAGVHTLCRVDLETMSFPQSAWQGATRW
jgi:hypothetical protein